MQTFAFIFMTGLPSDFTCINRLKLRIGTLYDNKTYIKWNIVKQFIMTVVTIYEPLLLMYHNVEIRPYKMCICVSGY